ncbi:MAG: (d)CMP kinase [Dehalococcoidia bacterium]|nr:MAG: (d)CMP kinase [Dehalococcoidia bacterium]
MPKPSMIAIDGPVASGKSTIGRLLAQRLGYRFVDTGAMYRALTWRAIKLSIDLEDEGELSRLAASTKIEFAPPEDYSSVFVDGHDVTREIQDWEVEAGVSLVARVAGVRKVLVEQQRGLAQKGKIVMAGRDIGTTVLPHAELKVYLVASFEERARRRYQELVERGEAADYEAILADLIRRDEIDSERSVSPLRPAPEARIIDTDGLSADQVLSEILSMMGEG